MVSIVVTAPLPENACARRGGRVREATGLCVARRRRNSNHPRFGPLWFRPVDYLDAKGESRCSFDLTRQDFMLLAMGWIGEQATARNRGNFRCCPNWRDVPLPSRCFGSRWRRLRGSPDVAFKRPRVSPDGNRERHRGLRGSPRRRDRWRASRCGRSPRRYRRSSRRLLSRAPPRTDPKCRVQYGRRASA
jgi:hypothetical protein